MEKFSINGAKMLFFLGLLSRMKLRILWPLAAMPVNASSVNIDVSISVYCYLRSLSCEHDKMNLVSSS